MDRPFKEAVDEFKLKLLKKALATTRYNQKLAAAHLGLTYHQFRGLYRQFKKELM
jgi:psp operon transcriptional activator